MASLLEKLKSKAAKPAEAPKTKKKERPVIDLRGKDKKDKADLVDRFAAADAIMKVSKVVQEAAKGGVQNYLKEVYFRICAEKGFKPENPNVITDTSKLNFIVKHVSKFKRTGTAGEVVSVAEQLKSLGFGQEVIDEIQTKVIKEKTHLGLKRFTDLQADDASPAQKAVAEKLMQLVVDSLNEDEQALVLEQSVETTVDEGWQDVAVVIACKAGNGDTEKSAVALEKLYSVIEPQFVCSQMQYSGKLDGALNSIQTEPVQLVRKVIESPNGGYRAICEGNTMTLYKVKDGVEERKGTKTCDNPGHAEASAKKLFRDSEALAEFLVAGK
jgi:hypothetical protein